MFLFEKKTKYEEFEKFFKKLSNKPNTNFDLCMQCWSCSNGCPYVELMDEPPHKIMRFLQYRMLKRTFVPSTIWVCVGCNTCSTECPMGIDIPLIFDALKKEALENRIYPEVLDIIRFHKEVLNSIKRYGRTHKLGIMLNFKLKSGGFLKDIDLGLKMLYKGKLDLLPHSLSSSFLEEIKRVFELNEE